MFNCSRSHTGEVGYYLREKECVGVYSNFATTEKNAVRAGWREMERKEKSVRHDAQVRTNYTLPMPNHYSPEKCIEQTRSILEKTGIRDCSYTIAVHEGKSGEVEQNLHVHLIVNERSRITGKKDRSIQGKQFLKTFRELYNQQISADMNKAHIPRERIPMNEWKAAPTLAREQVENFKAMKTITIKELREIPLVDVLKACGATRDGSDHCRWITADGGHISLDRREQYGWHDNTKNKGGEGAIDLYIHLKNCPFMQALDELPTLPRQAKKREDFFSVVAKTELTPEPIPPRSTDTLKNKIMFEYLTNIRKISPEILKPLIAEGLIFADHQANCCFLSHDKKGCEVHGSGGDQFKSYRGEQSVFHLVGEERKVAYVENAIEALSLKQLGFNGSIVSFGGQSINRVVASAKRLKEQGFEVISAFDNSPAGYAMGVKLKEIIPEAIIGIPKKPAKTWNEHLISRLSHANEKKVSEHVQEPKVSKNSLKTPPRGNGRGFGMSR